MSPAPPFFFGPTSFKARHSVIDAQRPEWLAGAAGFEPLHQESCPIGPTAIVRREEWQQIVRQTPAGA
jgi:hypothetical protein